MKLKRPKHPWFALAAVLLGVELFFLAPIVPYSTSFSIPNNFNSKPVSIGGQAPLAYPLLGYGPGPYPNFALATQGNETALVYFQRSSIEMAEGPFRVFGPVVLYGPGSIQVTNVELTPYANGLLNFSATVTGVPSTGFGPAMVQAYFDYPGYGSNTTSNGVIWHTPLSQVECTTGLNDTCTVSRIVAASPDLLQGVAYPMTIVMLGTILSAPSSHTTVNQGGQTISELAPEVSSFIYVQKLSMIYPGAGPNAAWVQAFINLANAQRGSRPLIENSTLDSFARTRFQTAVSNYVITDYGFDNQSAAFFKGTGTISTEEILYPGTFAPGDFVTYLQQYARGHWGALINDGYNSYGYYLGYGPVEEVNRGCPVTEITQHNVNITAVAVENGCTYKVVDENYLLFVLSS